MKKPHMHRITDFLEGTVSIILIIYFQFYGSKAELGRKTDSVLI